MSSGLETIVMWTFFSSKLAVSCSHERGNEAAIYLGTDRGPPAAGHPRRGQCLSCLALAPGSAATRRRRIDVSIDRLSVGGTDPRVRSLSAYQSYDRGIFGCLTPTDSGIQNFCSSSMYQTLYGTSCRPLASGYCHSAERGTARSFSPNGTISLPAYKTIPH